MEPSSRTHPRIFYSRDDSGNGLNSSMFEEVKSVERDMGKIADPSLALILGCIWAGRRASLKTNTIEFYNPQVAVLELLKSNLEKHFPQSTPKIFPPEPPHTSKLVIHSRPLARVFNFHTNGAEELPVHLLETKEEKLAFLRGVYLFSGSMNDQGITLGVSLGKRAAGQLARILSQLGVVPSVEEVHENFKIAIRDAHCLRKFLELGIFVDRSKQKKLKDHCDRKTGRVSIDPDKYHEFKRAFLSEPKKSIEQIARDISIPATTLRYWQSGNAPRTVTRERVLKEFISALALPDPGTMSYCYRHLDYSLPISLDIAKRLSEAQLKGILKTGEALDWPPKPDPIYIYDLIERLGGLVSDIFDVRHKVVSEKLGAEFARRARIVEWAASKQIEAPTFSDLIGKLVKAYHPLLKPWIAKLHANLNMESYGVSFEDSEQLAQVTNFECLSRTFDPTGSASFKTYSSSAIRNRMYEEFARVSKTGHKVVEIAKTISSSKEELSVEQLMEKFKCTKETAVHAQGLAGSRTLILERSADAEFDESGGSIGSLLPASEKDAAMRIETADLVAKVIQMADPKVKAIIKLVYSDGLNSAKASARLGMSEEELEQILQGFFEKVRIAHPNL